LTVSATVPSQNQIATATSPAVLALLKEVPAANLQGNGTAGVPATYTLFSGAAVANVALNQGSGDVEYVLSDADQVHFYYVVQRDHRQEPTQGGPASANIPGFGDTRDGLRQLMTFSEDHVFSSVLTNTARIGFNRIHLIFSPTALNPAAFDIGLPSGSPTGVAIPNIDVSGDLDFGGPTAEPQGRGDTTGTLNDTLSWLKGSHQLAFGGEIRRAYNDNISENIGEFIYTPTIVSGVTTATSIQNFLADRASTFQVEIGAGNDRALQPSWGLFAQDSFKWKPNFTINAGVRYEWNSTISEARSRFTNFNPATGGLFTTGDPYQTSSLNFEPRLGFAWDPFKDGKTSVRAAFAIMTQAPVTGIVAPSLTGNPPFALPIAVSSATSSITLENPSASITGTSLGPTAINPNFKSAYGEDWNLTIERQLTASTGLQVAYIGTKGTHLQLLENINQPLVVNGIYQSVRPFPTLPLSSPVLPPQCTAPNPVCPLNNIQQTDSVGNSNYNALWVTLTQRAWRGLQLLASYSYSKSLDYNSLTSNDTITLQNAYNPRGDYGPSEFDARHRIVASGIYALPFKSNRLVAGWQVGIITQAQSGNPLTPVVTIGPGPGISLVVRPNLTGPVGVTGNPTQWFANKSVFLSPCTTTGGATTCTPGNMARDSVVGPSFVNTDFSVAKDTKLNERFTLEFRAELFDIFNHPNFGNPSLTVGSSTFGEILSTRFSTGDFGSSRQTQLALKLMF
jgi:TonB dependent receptor